MKLFDARILDIIVVGEVLQLRIQIQHPLFRTFSYCPSSHNVVDETSVTETRRDRQVGTMRAFPRRAFLAILDVLRATRTPLYNNER